MTEQAAILKISEATGYKEHEVAVVKNVVAKGTTNIELTYFLNVAKSMELNPFNKEIWCYKDNRGNLVVFAGRDGFLAKAQRSPRWNGMTSAPVYESDHFKIDFANGKVEHTTSGKDRGKVIGAYAIIKPKDIDLATVVYIARKDYDKGYNVWKVNPAAMCVKTAESHALKKAFGISGLQVEYDFVQKDGFVEPIPAAEINDEITPDQSIEIYKLLNTVNLQPEEVGQIEREMESMTWIRAKDCIEYLKANQLDPASDGRYNMTEAGRMVEDAVENESK